MPQVLVGDFRGGAAIWASKVDRHGQVLQIDYLDGIVKESLHTDLRPSFEAAKILF